MTYDAVFVSDVHLGTNRCNTKKFYEFLNSIKTKKIIFVGDIIDIHCMEKKGTKWKKSHTECIHKILSFAKKGTEIVYILGNHESTIRRYCDFKHKNLKICNEYVYKTKDGKKYLCIHGDKTSQFSSGSWKKFCFNWGYDLITVLNSTLKYLFKFSLINYLKNTKKGKKYIQNYERDVASYASMKGKYDGVICGHIHHANMYKIGPIEYMCCGDFVDTCSAIFEKNGKFKIVNY